MNNNSKSFQNGKGSKPRPGDFKTYQENYSTINWKKSLQKEEKPFKLVYRDPQDYLDKIQG
jgi:hypothetical protein